MGAHLDESLEERLVALLRTRPWQRARELTDALSVGVRSVNAALDAGRGVRFTQDNAYRWSNAGGAGPPDPAPRTPLARLCGYYLDCLTNDRLDVLALVDSPDWVELPKLTLDDPGPLFEDPAAREMMRRSLADRHGLVLLLGYPVRLYRHPRGDGGLTAIPVCLWTFVEQRNGPPRIESVTPGFNLAFFRSLGHDAGDGAEEAIQAGEELGLYERDAEPPAPEELFARLRSIRPEWDWRDEPGEGLISSGPPLARIDAEGVYHRAMLVTGARSPYTQGLEAELRKLAAMPELKYAQTALGYWLEDKHASEPELPPPAGPLLEPVPLNPEQREAARRALESRLTVITGPPGTGKSQVVSAILANASWRGMKVLFASKNHQAVDVVEARCNGLGPRAALLRLGSQDHLAVLAGHVDALLAAAPNAGEQARLDESLRIQERLERRRAGVAEAWRTLLDLRNRTGDLEQDAEPARERLGEARFRALRDWRPDADAPAIERLAQAMGRALGRGNVTRELLDSVESARDIRERLGMTPPAEGALAEWEQFTAELLARFRDAVRAAEYFASLDALNSARQPAELAADEHELARGLIANSVAIWNSWLHLGPARLTASQRRDLGRYGALLRLMIAGAQGRARTETSVFREYYQVFPLVADAIHCWAVTSLSARMSPFDPAVFDLVVIDEASQCDIASALPLLYRARSAVVIGDSQQLRHIAGLGARHDGQLMARHGLAGGREHWSYTGNSLFDLAAGICDSGAVINLRDHFRSHADIIGLSNDQFYRGGLRIATRYERLRPAGGPAVRWVDVQGRARRPGMGGASNDEEARAVVALLVRLVRDEGYGGSIGVASPFRAQANRIRELIAREDALAGSAGNQILAGTVHGFQGDERDVMIFSPVVSRGMTDSGLRFLRNNGHLFNVAITRARASLIAVGDWHAAQSCGVEYLAKLARHAASLAETPDATPAAPDAGDEYPAVARPELVSRWEHLLHGALRAAGIRPVPQYVVEHHVLDFAVFDGERKLNIEVDGEAYHRRWDGESCRRDVIRNQRLASLGWDVKRFWVYQVRDDLGACVEWVKGWMNR